MPSPGRWENIPQHAFPTARWGHTLTPIAGAALIFGGELGLSHVKAASLWAVNLSSLESCPLLDVGVHPSPRRQHAAAALGDDGMIVVGGLGHNGVPLNEMWTLQLLRSNISGSSCSAHGGGALPPSPRPVWSRSTSALLARIGHSITPLPSPLGPPYLREGSSDAAYLIFGGRSTPRVAALARALGDGGSSADWLSDDVAEHVAANTDDAKEPDASPIALNDLLLLTRGPAEQWSLRRLMAANMIDCASSAAWIGSRNGRGSVRMSSALLPLQLMSDAEIEGERPTERAPRSHAPCGRLGHSAHMYRGPVDGLPRTSCGADGRAGSVGCLLVHAGADQASKRLDDLWLLEVDPSWARPREVPLTHPSLTWRALLPTYSGAAPPPRAHHASVLSGTTVFIIGGEAKQTHAVVSPSSGDDWVRGSALWALHVPSLRWTEMHAAGGVAPRPGGSAAAVLISSHLLTFQAKQQHSQGEEARAAEKERMQPAAHSVGRVASAAEPPGSILLLGGQSIGAGSDAMPLWVYAIGHVCTAPQPMSAPGCGHGETCNGETGLCVCTLSGSTPPCTHPAEPLQPPVAMEGGAMRIFGQAWAIIGVSIVGATAGGWVGRAALR